MDCTRNDNACKINQLTSFGEGENWENLLNQVMLFAMTTGILYSKCENLIKWKPEEHIIRPYTAYITPWIYRLSSAVYIIGEMLAKQKIADARNLANQHIDACSGENASNDCWLQSFKALKDVYDQGLLDSVKLKKDVLMWSAIGHTAATTFETVMMAVHLVQGVVKSTLEATQCTVTETDLASCSTQACVGTKSPKVSAELAAGEGKCLAKEAVGSTSKKMGKKLGKEALKLISGLVVGMGVDAAMKDASDGTKKIVTTVAPLVVNKAMDSFMSSDDGSDEAKAATECTEKLTTEITTDATSETSLCTQVTQSLTECESVYGSIKGCPQYATTAAAYCGLMGQETYDNCYCTIKNAEKIPVLLDSTADISKFASEGAFKLQDNELIAFDKTDREYQDYNEAMAAKEARGKEIETQGEGVTDDMEGAGQGGDNAGSDVVSKKMCGADHYYYSIRKEIDNCEFFFDFKKLKASNTNPINQITEMVALISKLSFENTGAIITDLRNTKSNSMATAKFQIFAEEVLGEKNNVQLSLFAPKAKINEVEEYKVGPLLAGLLEQLSVLNSMLIPKAHADDSEGSSDITGFLGVGAGAMSVMMGPVKNIAEKMTSFLLKRPLTRALLYGAATGISWNAQQTTADALSKAEAARTALDEEIKRLEALSGDSPVEESPDNSQSSQLQLTGVNDSKEYKSDSTLCMNAKMTVSAGCQCRKTNSCYNPRTFSNSNNLGSIFPHASAMVGALRDQTKSMANGNLGSGSGIESMSKEFNAKKLRIARDNYKKLTAIVNQDKSRAIDLAQGSQNVVNNLRKSIIKKLGKKGLSDLAKTPLFGGRAPKGDPAKAKYKTKNKVASYTPFKMPNRSKRTSKGSGDESLFDFDDEDTPSGNKVISADSKEERLKKFNLRTDEVRANSGESIFKVISSRYFKSYDKILEEEKQTPKSKKKK